MLQVMKIALVMIFGLFFAKSFRLVTAAATPLPFLFGDAANDTFTPLGSYKFSATIILPKPMTYLTYNVTAIRPHSEGYLQLICNEGLSEDRQVAAFLTRIDTRNGGVDQNQISFHVGNNTADLDIARNIIAFNGTVFRPQAMMVATWYKVETLEKGQGIQKHIPACNGV